MANLSNINDKFLFTDGDFLLIGGATANSISATESGVAIKNSNAATLSLQNSATNGKNHTLWSNTDGSFNITDVGVATRFTIASGGDVYIPSGNVSIGNTSVYPSGSNTILQIYSVSVPRLKLQNSTTGTAATAGSSFYVTGDDLIINNGETGAVIQFEIGGQPKMRIDGDGNVGIGTISPNRQFSIYGTNDGYMSFDGGRTGNHEFVVGSDTAGFIIYDDTLDTYRFVIDQDSGNVGIGTTSPAEKLHIRDASTDADVYIKIANDSRDWFMGVEGSNSDILSFKTHDASNLLNITSAGNVGINASASLRFNGTGDNTHAVGYDSTVDGSFLRGQNGMRFLTGTGGGSEKMRIESSGNSTFSGNVNINGTTGTPSISVKNSSSGGNNQIFQRWQYVPNNTNFRLDLTQRETAGLVRYAFDLINNGTAYNSNLVLDRGNVGIGTDSPTMKLHIAASKAGNVGVTVQNTNSSYSSQIRFLNSVGTEKSALTFVPSDTSLRFYHNGSDIMTITSGGDVLFGTTGLPNGTSIYGSAFHKSTVDRMILRMASSITGAAGLIDFFNPNGQVGYIATNGSATQYVTSSDYRLKENVVEMTGALDRVSQLKPSRFNFIADADKTVDGFLAHEVQEIVPEAITGEKDAVDEEGNPDYQGIDQSKLVPLLVGAIQELKAEIETLKTQINN